MTRNQQITIGRKIKRLIREQIGTAFSGNYQGAGEVATLVIAASSKKFTSKIKHFLRDELQLDLHVGSKNHGSGEHYTLQIALSDISEKSKKIIEEKIGKMNESKEKKEVVETIPTIETKEKKPADYFIGGQNLPSEEDSSPRPNFIKKISPFLNGVFRFESKFRQIVDPYVFDKKKNNNEYLVISCQSIRIAIEVEMALGWFLRDQSVIVREETDLLINHSEARFGNKSKSHYCLPPRSTADIFEVFSRLTHVRIGSKPKVEATGHSHFSVRYAKKEMIENIYQELRNMYWEVQKVDGALLIECIDWGVLPFTSPEEKKTNTEVLSDDIVIPGLTDAEKEALEKLQALVADKSTFDLLSEAKKKDVLDLLRTIDKKKKAEETEKYVESLLSVFKDYR